MDAQTIALLIAGGGALGIVVWVLAKIGRVLIKIAEALVAAAVVFLALWLMAKAVVWVLRQTLTHWRTSLTLAALGAWWHWWGLTSLAITVAVIGSVLVGGGCSTWPHLMPGRGGTCGLGGCAGRSTPRSCPIGCKPAA
jgi:S-DNA-T family DNA segregation ATPase FtsK/SpoIIIE